MKLLISFNVTDLDKALSIAADVAPYADTFTIGSLLLYTYGSHAVKQFRQAFPDKELFAEAHIVDHPKETTALLSKAGATYVSVMAGAGSPIIHAASSSARNNGSKVIIDLADASSVGQSALEAQRLGAFALTFHKPTVDEDRVPFIDQWQMVKGNTNLPIYLSAHISRKNVDEILALEPSGIIIGSSIIQADKPAEEAQYFADLIKK